MREAPLYIVPTAARARAASRPAGDVAQRQVRIASWAAIALILFVMIGPYLTFKPAPFTGEGSPLRQLCYLLVLSATIAASRMGAVPQGLFVLPASMMAVLLWCWASLGWAIEPDIASRRLVLTTVIIWTAFMLVEQLGFRRITDIMRSCLVVLLACNFLAVLLVPSIGIHQSSDLGGDTALIGNWRGILQQKNFTGATCAFTILLFVFDARRISPLLRWGVLFAAAFFLYKTSSKTSMGLLVVAVACGFAYTAYNPRYRLVVLSLLVMLAVPLYALADAYWNELTAPLNRQDAFTGRVQIWPVLLRYWQDNWLLGSGYGSFWNIGNASPVNQYGRGWVTQIASGHNGYLDLLTQIGLPGLVLTVGALILVPFVKLLMSVTAGPQRGALLLSFLLFSAGHNFTESSLMDRDQIVQVFLMITIALIGLVSRPPPPQRVERSRDRAPAVERPPSR